MSSLDPLAKLSRKRMENWNFHGRGSLLREIWSHKMLYIMLLPAMLFLFTFSYRPMAGVIIAFKDFFPGQSIWSAQWTGFDNFEFLKYPEFLRVLGNTLAITGLKLLFGFPAPILLALMFNEIRGSRFKRVSQSIVYLPHFMSWIVVAYIIESFLSPSVGLLNKMMDGVGMEPVAFLAKPQYFRLIFVASSIWKEVGWGTIIYLAAITSIDPSLYEAAYVEGAGRFKQMLYITLPCIMPTISVLLVLNIPNVLNVGMEQILPLMNPANLPVSDVLDTYILRNGLQQGNYSVSTAVGLLSSIVKLALILFTNYFSKKMGGAGLW